jgi:FkbM family methyltransferase
VGIRIIRKNNLTFQVGDEQHQRFWTKVEDGSWEPETFKVFDRFVTKETTCLDVGTWEGPTLLYAGQLSKTAFGFEPDPIAFAGLERNLAANPQIQNIQILNQCIAAETGQMQFGSRGTGGDTMSSLLFSGGQTVWTVPAIRLDEFVRERGLQSPLFIKIDIEGGEYSVLPSLDSFFRRYRPTVYLSTHPAFCGSVITSFLGKLRAHFRLMFALRSFPFLYDTHGRQVRLWELLLKKRWRENASIIATHEAWEK